MVSVLSEGSHCGFCLILTKDFGDGLFSTKSLQKCTITESWGNVLCLPAYMINFLYSIKNDMHIHLTCLQIWMNRESTFSTFYLSWKKPSCPPSF